MATSPYADKNDFIDWLNAPLDVELDAEIVDIRDTRIDLVLNSASSAVDSYCERTFDVAFPGSSRSETIDFYPPDLNGESGYLLPIGDTTEVHSVSVDGAVLSPASYRIIRSNKFTPWTVLRRIDGHRWRGRVSAQSNYGWPRTPYGVELATLMQAARWYQRPKSPLGVQTLGPEGDAVYVRINDPDIKFILRPFKRR